MSDGLDGRSSAVTARQNRLFDKRWSCAFLSSEKLNLVSTLCWLKEGIECLTLVPITTPSAPMVKKISSDSHVIYLDFNNSPSPSAATQPLPSTIPPAAKTAVWDAAPVSARVSRTSGKSEIRLAPCAH